MTEAAVANVARGRIVDAEEEAKRARVDRERERRCLSGSFGLSVVCDEVAAC